MSETLLTATGLSKYFKYGSKYLKAVDDISLEIQRGSTLGLVGESGSGKSTVARLILNLITPTAGKVEFLGQSLFDLPPSKVRKIRREMQIVFQNPYLSLFPHMSVGGNITEPFAVNKKEFKDMTKSRDKVFELMDLVGIPKEYYNAYPHEMSGGQQQRVGIARALAMNPKLIICDEPVSSLDVSIQAQILNLLQDLQESKGISYLFIAHNLAVVEHISKRVAVIYLGKIVECADTEDLYKNPLHPYTRALFQAVPVISEEKSKEFAVLKGEIPSPLDPPTGCRFNTRCEHVTDKCLRSEPEYRNLGNGHYAACHMLG